MKSYSPVGWLGVAARKNDSTWNRKHSICPYLQSLMAESCFLTIRKELGKMIQLDYSPAL